MLNQKGKSFPQTTPTIVGGIYTTTRVYSFVSRALGMVIAILTELSSYHEQHDLVVKTEKVTVRKGCRCGHQRAPSDAQVKMDFMIIVSLVFNLEVRV